MACLIHLFCSLMQYQIEDIMSGNVFEGTNEPLNKIPVYDIGWLKSIPIKLFWDSNLWWKDFEYLNIVKCSEALF